MTETVYEGEYNTHGGDSIQDGRKITAQQINFNNELKEK